MNKNIKGLIYVILFSLTWAILTIINKYTVDRGIEPLPFAYQTLFGATIILFLFIVFTRYNDLKSVRKQMFPRLASVGIIGSGLATVAMFYGLKYSTAINYGFIIKSTVVFSVLLAYIFLKEKINFQKIFYIIILLIGAYLISTKGQTIYPNFGDLIILLSAFFLASANILAKPILKNNSPEIVTLFRMSFGGLIILIFVPFIIPSFYVVADFKLVILRSIFVFLTLLFLNKTIRITTISYMTMMSMMFSVFVAIMGYLILNESMSFVQLIGGLLIIISIILTHKSKI